MKEIPPHPYAELFPAMPAAEIKDLADDIKARGLQSPIILYEGKVLDGCHRQEACFIAGVEPRFETYKGNDPLGFVISANLRRRHLTVGELAAIGTKLATLRRGGDRKSAVKNQTRNSEFDREKAAKTLGISTDSINVAEKIKKTDPSLFKQVATGKISLHKAESMAATKKPPVPTVRRDAIGREIPYEILAEWDRAHEVGTQLRSMVSKVKCVLEKGLESKTESGKDPIFRELTNPIISEASALHYSLSQILPYAVCPKCQGRNNQNCLFCRQRGFISKFCWEGPNLEHDLRNLILKQYASSSSISA